MIRPLLITDPAVEAARPTLDVDLIIDVQSLTGFYALESRLRALGFSQVQEAGSPLCRWNVSGVRIDVMPVDPSVLGFSNVWYETAMDRPAVAGEGEAAIRFLDAPHFCATSSRPSRAAESATSTITTWRTYSRSWTAVKRSLQRWRRLPRSSSRSLRASSVIC